MMRYVKTTSVKLSLADRIKSSSHAAALQVEIPDNLFARFQIVTFDRFMVVKILRGVSVFYLSAEPLRRAGTGLSRFSARILLAAENVSFQPPVPSSPFCQAGKSGPPNSERRPPARRITAIV